MRQNCCYGLKDLTQERKDKEVTDKKVQHSSIRNQRSASNITLHGSNVMNSKILHSKRLWILQFTQEEALTYYKYAG